jgi:hypothetical protein
MPLTWRILLPSIVLGLLSAGAYPSLSAQTAPGSDSAAPAASLTNDQIRSLILRASEKDIENLDKQQNYTYIQHIEERNLNGSGELKSTEKRTYEIMILYGEPVRRLVAKNDQPLDRKAAAKEEEKIQKFTEQRKNESSADREQRQRKEEKERTESRQFVSEVADAYNFRLVTTEALAGRETYAIDAEPKPGFEPRSRDARILPNFRFRVWIDRDESQWVKVDAQCLNTVSFGWFLARIHQGSRVVIEQTRVNDDVWLPKHIALKLDARLALLKHLNVEQDVTYGNYRKFRADTKILPLGEGGKPQ